MNEHSNKQGQAEFDKYASEYAELHASNIAVTGESPGYFAEYKIRVLASRLDVNETHSILDFGAGVGGSVPYFRQYFDKASLLCADVSADSLNIARKIYGSDLEYLVCDSTRIPLEDNQVDLVFVACVFHHILPAEHQQVLQEIRRVLRPGRKLYLFEHNPLNPLTVHAVNTCPFDENAILIKANEMHKRVCGASFSIVEKQYCVFFPAFLRMFRPLEKYLGWCPLGAQYFIEGTK